MKKVLIILFLLVCGFGLVGCDTENPEIDGVVVENSYIYYKEEPTQETILFEIEKLLAENSLLEIDAETIEFTHQNKVGTSMIYFEFTVNGEHEFRAYYERYKEMEDTVSVYRWKLLKLQKLERK